MKPENQGDAQRIGTIVECLLTGFQRDRQCWLPPIYSPSSGPHVGKRHIVVADMRHETVHPAIANTWVGHPLSA